MHSHMNVKNKKYLGIHVKCLIFLPDFKQIWIIWTDSHEVPNTKFNGNPSSGRRTDTDGQTWRKYQAPFATEKLQVH